MKWQVMRLPNGTALYHNRPMPNGDRLTVAQRDHGRWEWSVRRERDGIEGHVGWGECSTWQNARAAAEQRAAALAATEDTDD